MVQMYEKTEIDGMLASVMADVAKKIDHLSTYLANVFKDLEDRVVMVETRQSELQAKQETKKPGGVTSPYAR